MDTLYAITITYITFSVIHLETDICEFRDSHSQKPASPSDKRVSPIQHLSSFPVQKALLQLWSLVLHRARNCTQYGRICDFIFRCATRKKRVVTNLRLGFAVSETK